MPEKASLSLHEIERLRELFCGVLMIKRLTICRGGTLQSFQWHFGVVPKALYGRPNITFPPKMTFERLESAFPMVERDYLNDPKMTPHSGKYVTANKPTFYKNVHNSRICDRLTVCCANRQRQPPLCQYI